MAQLNVLNKIARDHHAQASLLANGHSVEHVALVLNVPVGLLRSMGNDPTFTNLVAHYTTERESNAA